MQQVRSVAAGEKSARSAASHLAAGESFEPDAKLACITIDALSVEEAAFVRGMAAAYRLGHAEAVQAPGAKHKVRC